MSNLIFVITQVGFSRILSPVRILGIDKGMGDNTNSRVVQGLSEFRCDWFVNLIPVVNLTFEMIYFSLIDDSRALVYLEGIDHRILVPSVPVMEGWNNNYCSHNSGSEHDLGVAKQPGPEAAVPLVGFSRVVQPHHEFKPCVWFLPHNGPRKVPAA